MSEPQKAYPCCAIPLFLPLILVVAGSRAGGSDDVEGDLEGPWVYGTFYLPG
ncbi:hypothetical protein [Streptomyces sp. TRM75563]|uniref:hypothetical protein n=1 Tax=Streptomyces sp. TRM75563 TaxID=2817418 RepID=UPI001F626397|nr:hypothetical protein [Streptomyces sp. TRM75563]MCI4042449.1 hypothetical protein [Streptomyces sp. TRM75563]